MENPNELRNPYDDIELPQSIIESFARFLVPEICKFYESEQGQPEFAIVVLDINGLKDVNDRCSHDFGDMLIIDCCRFICKTFKHSPVYRIGGDEFVVILESGDYDSYAQLMEEFSVGIEENNLTASLDNRFSIASGIAIYNNQSDLVFANVFKRADDAMYQNKAAMKEKEQTAIG